MVQYNTVLLKWRCFMDLKTKRWFVLVASLIINLCIGTGYAWSVYAKALIMKFGPGTAMGWAAAAIALTFTISNAVSPICMITGGKLQDKFGPRWVIFAGAFIFGGGILSAGFTDSLARLYISYGILAGFGMGLIYSCTIANTVKFFPDKRGLVAGLATGGYGFGPILFAPIIQSIISSHDVLYAFRTLGIVFIIVIAIGSLFVVQAPAGYKPEGWTPPTGAAGAAIGTDKTWSQMLADPKFYPLIIMLVIGATSGLMIISQAAIMARDVIKVSPVQAAAAVSFLALGNTGGRIIWGFISDKIGRYNALPIIFVLSAIFMMLLSQTGAEEYTKFVVSVMFVGFCFGGFLGIFPALTADAFGPKNNGINYGIMFTGFAIGGYIGPVMAATLKVVNEGVTDYSKALYIAAAMSVGGLLVTFVAKAMNKKTA
jgi:MFS family permease